MSENVNNKQNFAAWSIFTVASFSGYFVDGVECYMEIRSKKVKEISLQGPSGPYCHCESLSKLSIVYLPTLMAVD